MANKTVRLKHSQDSLNIINPGHFRVPSTIALFKHILQILLINSTRVKKANCLCAKAAEKSNFHRII